MTEKQEEDPRRRALALLEATHRFPLQYHLSVITVTDDGVISAVWAALQSALEAPLGSDSCQTVVSGAGRYTSHRFRVPVRSAEEVLTLYERLRTIEGVKSIL